MANRGGEGYRRWFERASALWLALVLVNYAVAGLGKAGAVPRFDGIRRELQAGSGFDGSALLRTLGGFLVAGLAAAGIIGWGIPPLRFVLRRTGAGRRRLPFAAAIGFGFGGMVAIALGLTGLFRAGLAPVWIAVGAVAAIRMLRSSVSPSSGKRRISSGQWFPAIIIAAALLALVSSSLGPETEIDSLTYHLARARHLLLEGRMILQPSLMFSFPPLWESWLGLLLGAGGEQAARLLNPVVVGLTVWSLHAMVERVLPGAGLVAGMLYAGSFLTVSAASASKNDPAAAWLCLAAFAAVFRSSGKSGSGWAVVAGIAAGSAILAKLTVVPVVAIAAVLLGVAGIGRLGPGVLAATFVAGPWAVHNLLQWGNPVHPVFRDLSVPPPSPGAALNLAADLGRYVSGSYLSLPDKLRAIWSVAVSEGMTPLALLALPVVVRVAAASRFALAGLAVAVAWSFGPPQPRYLLPALPLCAAAVAGWAFTGARARTVRWRPIAIGALSVLELLRAWSDPSADRSARWAVAAGSLDQGLYLRIRLTTYADTVQRLNAGLPSSARVLAVGERRGFPLSRKFVAVSFDDPAPLVRLAGESRDADQLDSKIRQLGVTHVLYNPMTADFLSDAFAAVRPADRALTVWSSYWRAHAAPVPLPPRSDLREGEFFLYELRSATASPPALLPGIEGWTDAVARYAASGDRPGALARLARVGQLAGAIPVLELWRVMIAGESMPAAEAGARLERAEASGLRVAHVYLGLARAAHRAHRKDMEEHHLGRLRRLAPESWLREPASGSATLVGR